MDKFFHHYYSWGGISHITNEAMTNGREWIREGMWGQKGREGDVFCSIILFCNFIINNYYYYLSSRGPPLSLPTRLAL